MAPRKNQMLFWCFVGYVLAIVPNAYDPRWVYELRWDTEALLGVIGLLLLFLLAGSAMGSHNLL